MGEKTKNDTCKGGGHPTTFKPHFTVRKKPKIWSGGSKIWPQNEPFCDFPENLASLEFHLISGFLTFLNENSTISSENKVKYSKISTNLLQNSAGLENWKTIKSGVCGQFPLWSRKTMLRFFPAFVGDFPFGTAFCSLFCPFSGGIWPWFPEICAFSKTGFPYSNRDSSWAKRNESRLLAPNTSEASTAITTHWPSARQPAFGGGVNNGRRRSEATTETVVYS